jgi:hypothetical protein
MSCITVAYKKPWAQVVRAIVYLSTVSERIAQSPDPYLPQGINKERALKKRALSSFSQKLGRAWATF